MPDPTSASMRGEAAAQDRCLDEKQQQQQRDSADVGDSQRLVEDADGSDPRPLATDRLQSTGALLAGACRDTYR